MAYREYHTARRHSVWAENNALMMLVIINVLMFILMHFIKTIYGFSRIPEDLFFRNIYAWFTMPAAPEVLLTRPWTVVTSFFTHLPLMLMLSNLFWLWTFGYIFQDLAGNHRLFPLYLYGGLAGAACFLLAYNILPDLVAQRATAVFAGATAPVVAVAMAAAWLSPQYRLFPMIGGGIPLWVIALVFIVIDLASISATPGLFFPHLGAAFIGYFFSRSLLRGNDWSRWMNAAFDRFTRLFQPERSRMRRKALKEEVFYDTRGKDPFRRRTNVTQQKVDEILDKINQKGIGHLSEEEKELLKRAGEEGL